MTSWRESFQAMDTRSDKTGLRSHMLQRHTQAMKLSHILLKVSFLPLDTLEEIQQSTHGLFQNEFPSFCGCSSLESSMDTGIQ